MQVWITKYALTRGILVREGVQVQPGMISVEERYRVYFHGNDWHATEAAAKRDACARRDRKIASLKKQITKLTKLEF